MSLVVAWRGAQHLQTPDIQPSLTIPGIQVEADHLIGELPRIGTPDLLPVGIVEQLNVTHVNINGLVNRRIVKLPHRPRRPFAAWASSLVP